MKRFILLSIIFLTSLTNSFSQVEYINITNPIYKYLQRAETQGLLPHFSLSDIPLQKYEITNALESINIHKEQLNTREQGLLEKYLIEFGIKSAQNTVLISSPSDSSQIISKKFFSDSEKLIFNYSNIDKHLKIEPLLSVDFMGSKESDENSHYLISQFGGRISGSMDNWLGYSIQATNGFFMSGDKSLALNDTKYSQNIKFVDLDSDIDFTNSHVVFKKDWFYASIEREERNMGAGLNTNVFVSRQSPAYDAICVGTKFKWFDYKYTMAGLLGYVDTNSYAQTGYDTHIPPKSLIMHRFALQPKWGEIALWEGVIYSNRPMDLAYINPLSFLKSVEHSLRDRDNSLMGADITIRPIKDLSLKGSFLLDDLVFSEIGTDYWSNKTAWNIALLTTLNCGIDVGIEYSKVDPFTYTHFNNQNSYTNDSLMIGGSLLPNSDRATLMLNYWYGQRYPLQINLSYVRHGSNVYDEEGNLIENVGGNPNIGHDGLNSWDAPFLAGNRDDYFSADIATTYEIYRGLNIGFLYRYNNFIDRENDQHIFRLIFKLNEF